MTGEHPQRAMGSCRNLVIGSSARGGEKDRLSLSAPASANNHVIHLHSRDLCGLGMESLGEFGVSARMADSLLCKERYVSFSEVLKLK